MPFGVVEGRNPDGLFMNFLVSFPIEEAGA